MTNEEAIERLEDELKTLERDCLSYHPAKEALKMAINSLIKQVSIKPILFWDGNENTIFCPSCKKHIFDTTEYKEERQYCGRCGQHVDWGCTNDE